MLPPYTYAKGRLAEERRQDVLREGEHARLMRRARPVRRRPIDHVLTSIGEALVTAGQTLQARHEPVRRELKSPALRTQR